MKKTNHTPPKESTPADTGGASTEGASSSDMGKPPAFQFYANDFLGSTITWDAIACGMYIRLLCTQWVNGSIPDDQRRIARAAGVELVELQREWHLIEPKFPLDRSDGTRKNPRLEEVRQRQSEVSEARKEAANNRWNSNAIAYAKRKQRKVKEKIEGEDEEGSGKGTPFENWWGVYAKGSKKLSREQWDRMSEEDRQACIAATPAYIASRPDKTYRRDGERFLRHRTWEDPIVTPTQKQPNGQPVPMTRAEAMEELRKIRARHGIPVGGFIEAHLIPDEVNKALR